jgi:hypothetical protein
MRWNQLWSADLAHACAPKFSIRFSAQTGITRHCSYKIVFQKWLSHKRETVAFAQGFLFPAALLKIC